MIRKAIDIVNKQNNEALSSLIGLSVLEKLDINEVNEDNINEGVADILSIFGLKAEKGSPGVIEYVAKFTSGIGKMIWYAIKKDKNGIKEMEKQYSKDEFIDFLYKLDLVTLHMITEPIHIIAGLTGWEIMPTFNSIKKSADNTVNKIKGIIASLKKAIINFYDSELQPILINKIKDLELTL